MPNMPGRNGVASSIHYPLPHPTAAAPDQGHLQQVVWYFRFPQGQTIVPPVDGTTGGVSTATLTAINGGSLLEIIGLAPAGYRVRGVRTRILEGFGTSGGLTALLIGDPVLNDRWGVQPDLTEGALTGQREAHSDTEPIAPTGGYALQVAVEGGPMDTAGRIQVKVYHERLAEDIP